jgi:hypothetical protein
MRRSTVLRLTLKSVFPGESFTVAPYIIYGNKKRVVPVFICLPHHKRIVLKIQLKAVINIISTRANVIKLFTTVSYEFL